MGAEAKAVVTELAFIDGNQYLADGLLHYPVHHRRDTKGTFLAILLRDFHTEDRTRAVSARFQGFHKFIFVSFQIAAQFLGRQSVYSTTAVIALDLQVSTVKVIRREDELQ